MADTTMNFWDRVGFPGTRVFQGLNAADDYWMRHGQVEEWNKDADLRTKTRELKEDNLDTVLPITKKSNAAMRALSAGQQEVLNSPEGYIGFLNSSADPNKGRWVLGADGKTAEMLDPAGTVIGRQELPVDPSGMYSGSSAVNDIMRKYGTSLLTQRDMLPEMDRFGATMALGEDRSDLALQRMLLGKGGKGMGLGGLGLGGGAGGGKGGASGKEGKEPSYSPEGLGKMTLRELFDLSQVLAADALGQDFKPGESTLDPEGRALAALIRNDISKSTLAGTNPAQAIEMTVKGFHQRKAQEKYRTRLSILNADVQRQVDAAREDPRALIERPAFNPRNNPGYGIGPATPNDSRFPLAPLWDKLTSFPRNEDPENPYTQYQF